MRKEELTNYLIDIFDKILNEITEKHGKNTAIFIEYEESNKISIYYSRKCLIKSFNIYVPAGEKILYTKIDISQYNKKSNKTIIAHNGYIINEIIDSFYCKIIAKIKANFM